MRQYKSLFQIIIFYTIICTYAIGAIQYNEKKFVIVIPSYNNSKYYERNVKSALSQQYSSFRIIYTDDCSPDGTGNLVENFLEQHDTEKKVTLVKNKDRRGALHNLYTMIHSCDDDEIIVTLDGDDWLPDDEVLLRLNTIYCAAEVWLTYGQFKLYPSNTVGWACAMPDYIVEHNAFRDFQHLPTHLRTFYAWLFKHIKTEDFLYLGQFYPMTWDMVMMFPMIEMAGERHAFISDIMYVYNDENSISDHHVSRQLQAHLAQVVKQKKRYQRLTERPDMRIIKNDSRMHADVVVFAQNPGSLEQLLTSLTLHVQEMGDIFVMYETKDAQEQYVYSELELRHPAIQFCLITEYRENFKSTLYDFYSKSKNEYILFLKDGVQFYRNISIARCIELLQDAQAYAFYFKLNAQDAAQHYQSLPLIECRQSIFAWNFSLARDKWSCANSLDGVLHKKTESFVAALQGHYNLTPNGLEMVWANEGDLDRLGLCFKESCVD